MSRILRTLVAKPVHVLAFTCLAVIATDTRSVAQSPMEHRWAGTIFDSFTLDGQEVWTCEGGGVIRHRSTTGVWSYQDVPDEVRFPLLRIHFVDTQNGWAVSQDGYLIKTTNGGATWTTVLRSDQLPGFGNQLNELWDVHFLDHQVGWLVGLHAMWYTDTGGNFPSSWQAVTLLKQNGMPFMSTELADLEFYAVDVVTGIDPPLLGMACAEPGLVFRTDLESPNPLEWKVVFDVTSLCGTSALKGCEEKICPAEPPELAKKYEPWDIEIAKNPGQKLAIMAGGWGFACGMIFTTDDDGEHWTKENHLCYCPDGGGPPLCYICPEDPNYVADPPDLWFLSHLHTLYGVAITDDTGQAVAAGYAGQIVVRDPVAKRWPDRSQYSEEWVTTPAAVSIVMKGVTAPPGVGSNSTVLVTGVGGYMRRSTDAGQTWVTEPTTNGTVGEPWRITDVSFFDLNNGWMVSQFFRLAKSITGAATWDQALPPPEENTTKLWSIVINGSNPLQGVAVGQPYGQVAGPRILYTTNGGASTWLDASFPHDLYYNDAQLREAEWVGASTFWAAGSKGLIARSMDGGASWSSVLLGQNIIAQGRFDIQGLGFSSASKLVFVGEKSGAAAAYQYRDIGGQITWTAITINDLNPLAPIALLADVDVSVGTAYAVGYRENANGERTGVLLKSTVNGSGDFQSFDVIQEVAACITVEPGELPIAVLNQVEFAPGTQDVFVGGDCGRVWKLQASPSAFISLKSQTSAGIRGISFPSSSVGYFAAHRTDGLGNSHAIVRYNP